MAKPNKTQQTGASVDTFLAKVKPSERRNDCETIVDMMTRVAGEPARMWGPSIVGVGVRKYRYESGREGEICELGFSPRATALTFYGLGAVEHPDAIAALGKVKTSKACVHIKRLADIDLKKLEAVMRRALEDTRAASPTKK